MLNINWVSMLKTAFTQLSSWTNMKNTSGANVSSYPGGFKHVLGNALGQSSGNWIDYTFNNETSTLTMGSSTGGFFLLLGASNTEPTAEDYKLGDVLTDYTTISQSHYFNNSNEVYTTSFMTLTRTIQNETAASITIKEIGAYYKYEGNIPIMIAREVIEPVTLQPGEKHSFTMDICVQ